MSLSSGGSSDAQQPPKYKQQNKIQRALFDAAAILVGYVGIDIKSAADTHARYVTDIYR